MKVVRLDGYKVVEIIPEYALPINEWYPADFCASCVEAPDDVCSGYVFDGENFYPPEKINEPEPKDKLDEIEQRLNNIENIIKMRYKST